MLIRDIRFYHADMDNVDGYPLPAPLEYPAQEAAAARIAMKLREMGFSMGDYSDLKLNFTPCIAQNTVQHAMRTATSKNAHYVDVGVSRDMYDKLKSGDPECADKLMAGVSQALMVCYGAHHEDRDTIRFAIEQAMQQGEDMEMLVREKQGLFGRGKVLVKYRDSGVYQPRLRVEDRQGNELLNVQLPEVDSLDAIGDIQVGMKRAAVHYQYGEQRVLSFPYKA